MDKMLPNNIFYDGLAAKYDEMISFEKSIGNKKNLLANFVTDKTKNAADIGCGSGVDSIALALSGIKVTAFEPSAEMVKVAKANAQKMNIEIEFHKYPADQIPDEHNNKFDLVVSLGNTFANISPNNFKDSIKRCCEILKPNGQILVQILNYRKILEYKKRIVNITEGSDNYFIRLYDFNEDQIVFNILTFNKSKTSDFNLISTRVYPYLSEDFESELNNAGFNHISFYGDLKLSEFIQSESNDLIINAVKD